MWLLLGPLNLWLESPQKRQQETTGRMQAIPNGVSLDSKERSTKWQGGGLHTYQESLYTEEAVVDKGCPVEEGTQLRGWSMEFV